MRHYVFGYGSLICAESRAVTASALGGGSSSHHHDHQHKQHGAIPVRLRNWVRLWNVRGPNTYLGVAPAVSTALSSRKKDGSVPSCVGVLVPLPTASLPSSSENESSNDDEDDDKVLKALDRREMGYHRHCIEDLSLIERVDDLLLEEESSIYTKKKKKNSAADENQKMLEDIENRFYKNTFLKRRKRLPLSNQNGTVAFSPPPHTNTTTNNNNAADNNHEENSSDGSQVCVWIYVPQERYTGMACVSNPILQSYVDICLRGCLSISQSFAREFIQQTYGWHPDHCPPPGTIAMAATQSKKNGDKEQQQPCEKASLSCSCWVDDRQTPIYVRADKEYSVNNSQILDSLFDSTILRRRSTLQPEDWERSIAAYRKLKQKLEHNHDHSDDS